MGWLDKLLGRDKQDEGEASAAPTASVEDHAPAAAEDDPHAGHDHPPGEHPRDELS